MVNEFEIKKQICDIGRRIYNRNMVAANDGNISVKLNDNEFLCTSRSIYALSFWIFNIFRRYLV